MKNFIQQKFWSAVFVLFFCVSLAGVSSAGERATSLSGLTQDVTFEEAMKIGEEKEIVRKFTEEVESLEDETQQLREIMAKHAKLLEENLSDYPAENRIHMKFSQDKISKLMDISRQQQDIIAQKEETLKKLKSEVDLIAPQSVEVRQENDSLRTENAGLREDLGEAYQQLGVMHTHRQDYMKAIQAYEKAILYDPAYTQIYYHLGLLYEYEVDDSERAIAYFTQYLNLDPDAQNRKLVEELIEMVK